MIINIKRYIISEIIVITILMLIWLIYNTKIASIFGIGYIFGYIICGYNKGLILNNSPNLNKEKENENM